MGKTVVRILSAYTKLAMEKLGIYEPTQLEVERLAICYECNDRSDKCPECGCPVKAKVLDTIQGGCPLKKWQ